MRQLVKRLVLRLLDRLRIDLTPPDRWGVDLMRDLRRVAADARVVFDVGANRGQSAREFLAAFPNATVYSYEPQPDAYATLRTLASPRLHVENYALGTSETTQVLHITENDVGSSLLAVSPDAQPEQYGTWVRTVGTVEVAVRRLDAVMAEQQIACVDVLKVDAQGFDLEVLKGAGEQLTPANVRVVVVELSFHHYYDGQASASEIMGYLTARGYRPLGLYAGARDAGGRIDWCDVLFA